ncbi:MAG: hypothetical protein ABI623_10300, partial [bacterium]
MPDKSGKRDSSYRDARFLSLKQINTITGITFMKTTGFIVALTCMLGVILSDAWTQKLTPPLSPRDS